MSETARRRALRRMHLFALAALASIPAHAQDAQPETAAPSTTTDAVPPTAAPSSTTPDASAAAAASTEVAAPRGDEPTDENARRLSVAVLDLQAAGDVQGIAKALTTLVAAEVDMTAGYDAVSRGDLQSLLAHQSDAQLLGCVEVKCMADIARLAAADRVVGGAVERGEGGAVVFSLVLIDPAGPVVLERIASTWRSAPDDMVDLVRPSVDRLLLGKRAGAHRGALDVLAPAGATIAIDGKPVGTAPLKGPVRDLPIGVHAVSVEKPGFVPYSADVAVAHGETRVHRAVLVDQDSLVPFYARWYVWGSALGAVAVVGGTAAAVGTWAFLQNRTTSSVHVDAALPLP